MALTSQFANEHIAEWSHRLQRAYYPFRSEWPSGIFRHDPLQNIAQVLNTGQLLSRAEAGNAMAIDAAEAEIVNRRDEAHSFVRMYFRPRTPTQYRIEGIKKSTDPYRTAHIPMLGMMIFDATSLLTKVGVKFSSCNMQKDAVEVGEDENFFREKIDFSKVYHFGAHNDETITAIRCAEVLLPSPLEISEILKFVYCRSNPEKETLAAMLTPETLRYWNSKIRVSDDLQVFEKRFPYVQSVSLSQEGLVARFARRPDAQPLHVSVVVQEAVSNRLVVNYDRQDLPAVPEKAKNWLFQGNINPGLYHVTIRIEGCLAFEADLHYQQDPF